MDRLISVMAACCLTILTVQAARADGLGPGWPGPGLLDPGLPDPVPLNPVLSDPEPFVTPLGMHPAYAPPDPALPTMPLVNKPPVAVLPTVVHPGTARLQDPRKVPIVKPPDIAAEDPGKAIIKAGTGFFIGADGSLLTVAHVVEGCGRTQIVSKYLPRAWASVVASDPVRDIALLRALDVHPPGLVRLGTTPPVSARLFVMGFPAAAGLVDTEETWGAVQNQKFPPGAGSLANPSELLWLQAPSVTHGYSGGPIFDAKLGAVVGIVKGEVDAGYLRLVREMPTTGISIGPGIGDIGSFLRDDARYTPMSAVSSTGEAGLDVMRHATVHVMCWRASK